MRAADVTVLICTHADEATIEASVASALQQSVPRSRYEVLVVDDGSPDATAARVARFAGEGVRLLRLGDNRGLTEACNAGLAQVATPWFVRLDGDDRFAPGLLEALLERRPRNGTAIIATDRVEEGPDGERTVRSLSDPPRLAETIAAGMLLPTDRVRAVGGYRRLFWEEYDLLLRLLQDGCFLLRIPEVLYHYSVGAPGRMTSSPSAVRRGWSELTTRWPAHVLHRHGLRDVEGVPGRAA